ncbi:DUF7848 domain-containing protein [Streptomyces turgidiscabies]|uniref:DUF7848 domain-containing protein n=1 Tax=Streptomyces turgidiscabies TaxID=85558 RepID=A0ABU0RSJ1_9ACTN|nr:hypothetical protein [Streptomyces turgidiscabies]MDQ0934940.1 hypothetical protein [Streptomyces turgidiscabies]
MTTEPFPRLWSFAETSALPSRRWVECVNCIENVALDDGSTDPQEWAVRHTALHPDHVRYRVVSQVGFRLDPAGVLTPSRPGTPGSEGP